MKPKATKTAGNISNTEIFQPKPVGRRVDTQGAHKVPVQKEPDYASLLRSVTQTDPATKPNENKEGT